LFLTAHIGKGRATGWAFLLKRSSCEFAFESKAMMNRFEYSFFKLCTKYVFKNQPQQISPGSGVLWSASPPLEQNILGLNHGV
jgi:hypothetical protein